MGTQLQHFVDTEAGHNHPNEDRIAVIPHPEDTSALLCALADGQGGRSHGATAAHIAVETCLEFAASYPVSELREIIPWYPILSGADGAVCDGAEEGLTTLIGLCVTEEKICGASCGDSTVLLMSRGKYRVLTENQRKNPTVGSGEAYPVAFEAEFRSGDTLLLMSDGVWRYIGFETIAKIAMGTRGEALISRLRQWQLDQNHGELPDDFSLILVEKP